MHTHFDMYIHPPTPHTDTYPHTLRERKIEREGGIEGEGKRGRERENMYE